MTCRKRCCARFLRRLSKGQRQDALAVAKLTQRVCIRYPLPQGQLYYWHRIPLANAQMFRVLLQEARGGDSLALHGGFIAMEGFWGRASSTECVPLNHQSIKKQKRTPVASEKRPPRTLQPITKSSGMKPKPRCPCREGTTPRSPCHDGPRWLLSRAISSPLDALILAAPCSSSGSA